MRLKISCFILAMLLSLLSRSQSPASVYVHFAFDKWELSAATKTTLDSLTDSLDVTDRIELHGHCDALGADVYNDRLSAKRVQAVKEYLVSLGWENKDILIAKGHGEKKPLNKNASPEERSLNRRVEIKIIYSAGDNEISLTKKLADTATIAGTNIVLKNINFVGGRHQFLPQSEPALKELLKAMKTYPKLVIRVEGHICCEEHTGDGLDDETGIINLSEARAKAVMDYLVTNGIQPERISYKGFGHAKPIYPYPEKTGEEMIRNRRVEIKIISR
ncbi:MAG: OmpA family protein [Chitinophagaceae bacterium]